MIRRDDDYALGTWKPLFAGKAKSATVVCPNGHLASLEDHQIDESGKVYPSVDCPYCDFHESIQLESWK